MSIKARVCAFCLEHMGEPGSVSIGTCITKAAILVGTNWVLCGHFQSRRKRPNWPLWLSKWKCRFKRGFLGLMASPLVPCQIISFIN